jgi:hypothetical protein
MSEDDLTHLKTATTEDLLDEIASRSDAVVFGMTTREERRFRTFVWGGTMSCLGLAHYLEKRALERAEASPTTDDI